MSRIEQVMRELSDLRDFYLKVQRRHESESSSVASQTVAEGQADYNRADEARQEP